MIGKKIASRVNICLSTDDSYIQHTATTIASILLNAKGSYPIHFYILSSNLSEKNRKKLKKLRAFEIEFPTLPTTLMQIFRGIMMPSHLNFETFNRLLLPQILSADVKRILYLDSDLIVLGDCQNFLNTTLGESQYFAAVEDVNARYHQERLGYDVAYTYVNAGSLLMDLDKLRKINYYELMKKRISQNKEKYLICDQDVLNDTFHKNIKVIDHRWNMFHEFNVYRNIYNPKDLLAYNEAVRNPIVIHYVGVDKPWNQESNHPYKKDYIKYLMYTPWKKKSLPKKTITQKIKGIFFNIEENQKGKKYKVLGVTIMKKKID